MNIAKLIFFLLSSTFIHAQNVFKTSKGMVNFKSDAALELIQANSDKLIGVIDVEKKTFIFSVKMNSFEGFNVGLQKEHFNENYLESDKFKTATFNGKIIEDINFFKDGEIEVRAKGILNIHGIEQERIIKCFIKIKGSIISVESEFKVLLDDHQIRVPKVVYEKVASEILVRINAELALLARK